MIEMAGRFNILLLMLSIGFTVIADDSLDVLRSNNQLYSEMSCVPLAKDGNGRVLSYDCNHVNTRDKDKCYYNGKIYEKGQRLLDEDNIDPCLAACFCEDDFHYRTAKFTCAGVECPSFFGRPLKPPCYYRYKLNKCCGVEFCPESKEIVHTCAYQDRQYKEGEIIYHANKKCLCTKDFDGTLKDEWCQDIRCKYELLYNKYLHKQDCAPVYFQKLDGCPIEWICYNETGTPQSIAHVDDTKSTISEHAQVPKISIQDHKCKFGSLELSVGQKLEDNNCVECSCNVPPYLTCNKKESC